MTTSGAAEALPQPQSLTNQLGALARAIVVAVCAGGLAGIVAGGFGGRIAMRISAATAGDARQGSITEAEAVVGEITFDGTVGLIIFGGLLVGILGGLLYASLRRWLADAGPWRGLAFGVIVLAMFGWTIIEGDNPDFRLFGPRALNIAMFSSIFLIFGLLMPPVHDWVSRSLPRPALARRVGALRLPSDYSPKALVTLLIHGIGLFFALTIVAAIGGSFGEDSDNQAFFGLMPAYVIFVLPLVAVLLARAAGRFEGLSDLRAQPGVMAAALAALAVPVIVGVVLDMRAVLDIYQV